MFDFKNIKVISEYIVHINESSRVMEIQKRLLYVARFMMEYESIA
jgi:hypothetical protein